MIPTINITDYHLCESGIKTHQTIRVCKQGVLALHLIGEADRSKIKPRALSIAWEGVNLLVYDCEADEPLHIISAPYHIQFEKGV